MKKAVLRFFMIVGIALCLGVAGQAQTRSASTDSKFNISAFKDATVIVPETDPEIEIRIDRRDIVDYAQNVPADEKRLILKAVKAGIAKVSIYSKTGQFLRTYNVTVKDTSRADKDAQEATNADLIKKLVDDVGLEVAFAGEEGNRMVVLQGEVEDDLARRKALNIAQAFYPNRVLDFIQIREPLQVRVKCQVVQVQTDNETDIGLQYRAARSDSKLGVPIGINGANPITHYPFFFVRNSNKSVNGSLYDINAMLNLSDTAKKIKILQEPTLTVLNGQPATFLVGQRLPYRRSTSSNGTLVTEDIDFLNVGISLLITPIAEGMTPGFTSSGSATSSSIGVTIPGSTPPGTQSISSRGVGSTMTDAVNSITPTVDRNGLVKLFVKPEVSIPDFNNLMLDIPVINVRFVETRVALHNNQALVLGGLFDDQMTKTLEKVPFVADIPIIGELFKNRTDSKVRNELVFILTPEVVLPEKIAKGDTLNPRLSDMVQHMNDYGLSKYLGSGVKPTRISAAEVYVRKGEAQSSIATAPVTPEDNAQPLVPLRQGTNP